MIDTLLVSRIPQKEVFAMRTFSKITVGVAFAALAVTGGTAFTGAGVTSSAPDTQLLGGTVSQSVVGANLDSVTYMHAGDGTLVTGISFSLTTEAGSPALTATNVTATANGTAITLTVPVAYVEGTPTEFSSTVSITDLTSLAITVVDSPVMVP